VVITDDEKKKVEEGVKALKDVKDKDDVEAIKKAADALSKDAQAVGAKMYQQNQQAGAPGAENKTEENKDEKKGDEPIEGEVVK
ncbi:MAG TPA: molecular chaperone DnaK, partial [Candidatus Magasanikbacteria bacterium]|nr:molecular chaperone DnaK [Candidatus Magasanikbacteria bacterium]